MSAVTSMWQTVNLTDRFDPMLIDNGTLWFNLSAWIGGYSSQNDNARVSVIFTNQANQMVGSRTTIGPVMAANRTSQSSLIPQQTNALVPIGARFATVLVTITRVDGSSNDGSIDDISIAFYL